MSGPRLSVIPAPAVTDHRLEPRDLQTLCLLGEHIDKLGWCCRSQVRMARELGCGRATLQRSLARLVEAGYVEQRPIYRDSGADAAHEYRVILDVADTATIPGADADDAGEPPGDESRDGSGGAHERAGVPTSGQGVPTHGRAPMLTAPVKRKERESAGAPESDSGQADEQLSTAGQGADDFRAAYPASGQDDQVAIDRAWAGLTPDERQRAMDRLPAFLAERDAQRPKLGRLFAQIYLSQKRFDQLGKAVAGRKAKGSQLEMLEHHSRVWWAHMHKLIGQGDQRTARLMASLARSGSGYGVPSDQIPTLEDVSALQGMPSTSPEWEAWSAWFRARGIMFPYWSKQQWCWLPSRWPPDHRNAGDGTDQHRAREGPEDLAKSGGM